LAGCQLFYKRMTFETHLRRARENLLRMAAMLVLACAAAMPLQLSAAEARTADDAYLIQPGDLLIISVWKEEELRSEVLVRPDGGLSFPLVGDITAKGRSTQDVRAEITARLQPYLPAPVVTVSLKQIGGNRIFVVGKVNRPGEINFSAPLDVMQVLSLAGGGTPYASLNRIVILRRTGAKVETLRFNYGQVGRGRKLQQNIVLRSGDTVVVP
jgi:polysaccharide biosynthesis/export protein